MSTRLALFTTTLVASLLPVAALSASTTVDPWVLLSAHYGGTPHSMSFAPQASSATASSHGVLFAGGDDGGAWRSLTCGDSWEPVNGGYSVTNGSYGGYGMADGKCSDAAGSPLKPILPGTTMTIPPTVCRVRRHVATKSTTTATG